MSNTSNTGNMSNRGNTADTIDVHGEISPAEKRQILARLLQEKARQAIPPRPMSHGQRSLWFMYQLDPGSAAYNVMYAARVRLNVDCDALRRAFQMLVDRHAVLRTTYGTQDGQAVQQVHAQQDIPFEIVDANAWPWERLEQEIQDRSDLPFDLEHGPVIRVQLFQRPEGEQPVVLFAAHHIALDFWSFDLLFDELESLYRQEVTGTAATLWPVKLEYTDYVAWQEQLVAGQQGERDWQYWQRQLDGELPNLDLPTDRPRPPLQSFRGRSYHFQLPDELAQQLIDFARQQSATLYATLLAAFQVLLYRYSGQRDILVGSPTAGRSRAELEDMLGYFLNPVVLRGRISPDESFASFLGQVRDTVIDSIEHQDFPFPLLVERLQPPRDASRSPIFQVAFGWDKPRRMDNSTGAMADQHSDEGALALQPFALGQQGAAFDMMLMMLNIGSSVSAALQYNSDLFEETTIERMVRNFQNLLKSILANPDQAVADLPIMDSVDSERVLENWNDTDRGFPRERCLHEWFQMQAESTPAAIAVECGEQQLTYRELDRRSNQLAHYLSGLGVEREKLVAICTERSIEMLVGILGILKSGAAYVPLSPGTPHDRMAYMLDESQASVVLTQDKFVSELPTRDAHLVRLDQDWNKIEQARVQQPSVQQRSVEPPTVTVDPSDLAYVIFTSGSTGKPKGVQLEHRSVINFLHSMQREPGIGPDDSLLAVTTLTFDISVLELFLPLVVGAKVVIVGEQIACDGLKLSELLQRSGATVMQATPATWRLLVEAGWAGDPDLKVLCGGEALPRDLADQLLERCASLWNMYGPTETTIWSAVDRVQSGEGPPPIGRPIDNTQLYILDARLKPVPIGVPGDLYIGGAGLARGYLNRPELTAQRFVASPFGSGRATDDPARMYKTGDVARYRPDGKIEFLGRADFQVKLRGFRIELGELEAILAQHPAVRQAVVMARQNGAAQTDEKQLVAYLVPETDSRPNTNELREFLRQDLPDYMLPASFMWLDSFPLNPAGKIDRKTLPEPDTSRPELHIQFVAPRNETEEVFADIFASVLGVDQVGVYDNYFDLGGASIQSLEIGALAKSNNIHVTPAMLFQYPTIAELAAVAVPAAPTAATEFAADTDGLDGLSAIGEFPQTSASADKRHAPQPRRSRETKKSNAIIESMGVYLPPKIVTTKELLKGCKKKMWFPLERMTGIHSRRMAGETEFSIDLARKAVSECLEHSKYGPDDIDLVIACNITRLDGDRKLSVEPNTSMQLRSIFGLDNAIALDVCNACSGMFTAISIVEAMLETGMIRRALVVSGEYITEISKTAQLEIDSFMDSRIACLTVGDAGAAILLEAASNRDVGFHELEMYSLSKYAPLCIGKLTDQPHGGAIMYVPDPMEHTAVAVHHSVLHARHMFETTPWNPDDMDLLILHQTSGRSLRDAKRAINKAFRHKICNDDNTISNIAERGNTATTTQFVAVWDNIINGKIKSGDRVLFGITGSGQTIGTGIYTFDDLPDRIRHGRQTGQHPRKIRSASVPQAAGRNDLLRVQVHSTGTIPLGQSIQRDTPKLNALAAAECLKRSTYDCRDIELLIFGSVSRTDYISEPAIAALIARELEMNDTIDSPRDRKTFVFDIFNGALGLLNSCHVATQLIQAGTFGNAMLTASEVEVNDEPHGERCGVYETASALILEPSSDGRQGFGQFVFKYFPQFSDSRVVTGAYKDGKPYMNLQVQPELNDHYLQCIPDAVQELLDLEGLEVSQIRVVLPPQFSTEFNHRLAKTLGIPTDRVVDVDHDGKDLFTSSLPYALEHALDNQFVQPGDIGLIINVASGIQIGCATYHF